MSSDTVPQPRSAWKFPRVFRVVNIVELLDRSAYYAVFIAIAICLTRGAGWNNILAIWLGGFSDLYSFPCPQPP